MYICIYTQLYTYSLLVHLFTAGQPAPAHQSRHRLNGYLACLVPSPPDQHTFQKCTIQTAPRTAGKKKTRYPLGEVPV